MATAQPCAWLQRVSPFPGDGVRRTGSKTSSVRTSWPLSVRLQLPKKWRGCVGCGAAASDGVDAGLATVGAQRRGVGAAPGRRLHQLTRRESAAMCFVEASQVQAVQVLAALLPRGKFLSTARSFLGASSAATSRECTVNSVSSDAIIFHESLKLQEPPNVMYLRWQPLMHASVFVVSSHLGHLQAGAETTWLM